MISDTGAHRLVPVILAISLHSVARKLPHLNLVHLAYAFCLLALSHEDFDQVPGSGGLDLRIVASTESIPIARLAFS
ncbi:hypothetical protein JL39_19745 [Rhizobium sp. YS-1r]|nr:hypothetical protein JL39_19745 [Rhizobium sp. YS-1r]